MQNKSLNTICITILSLVGLFLFSNATYAISDAEANKFSCPLNYGAGALQPFATYKNVCCPTPKDVTPGGEPIDGKTCYDGGKVLRETSDAAVAFCIDPVGASASSVESIAKDVYTKNWKGFNCLRGTKDTTCRDSSYCKNSTGACQTFGGDSNSCVATKKRIVECDSSCSACLPNYTYCGLANNVCQKVKVGPNKEFDDVTLDTATKYPCSVFGAQADPCTGVCLCPTGYTYSGRQLGQCVPFFVRFSEIFEDGLTWLGGHPWDPNNDGTADDFDNDGVAEMHAYDYSETGPTGLKDVFMKTDMSEVLNWNSTHLPPPLKWLLSNYYLCTVDGDCTGVGQECSEGGICYTPAGAIGSNCPGGKDSECNVVNGLVCDSKTLKCTLPAGGSGGYTPCTLDSQCGVGGKCAVAGFCYMPVNKDVCATMSDCNFLEGYVCNLQTLKCEVPTPEVNLSPRIVGLTSTTYDGGLNGAATKGYAPADKLCNTAYAGSHICTSKEIINSYVVGATTLPAAGVAWINSGAPGNVSPFVNDCKGWGNGANFPYFGTVWNFTLKAAGIQQCNFKKSFACCK